MATTTGRQRSEGGLPSGNNRRDRVRRKVKPGAHAQTATQDARSANGRDPGETPNPKFLYAVAASSIDRDRPITRKTHPMRFPGWRDAMIQPTMP
jgi:hypothetical protein